MGSWVSLAPQEWYNNSERGNKFLATMRAEVQKLASGTVSVFPKESEVDNKKLQLEAQAFLDWYNSFCEVVSLIHTGTTTALKEGQYGSYSAKESTDVREKSQREKFNAARVSNFWTWRFIPLLVDVNFRP